MAFQIRLPDACITPKTTALFTCSDLQRVQRNRRRLDSWKSARENRLQSADWGCSQVFTVPLSGEFFWPRADVHGTSFARCRDRPPPSDAAAEGIRGILAVCCELALHYKLGRSGCPPKTSKQQQFPSELVTLSA